MDALEDYVNLSQGCIVRFPAVNLLGCIQVGNPQVAETAEEKAVPLQLGSRIDAQQSVEHVGCDGFVRDRFWMILVFIDYIRPFLPSGG